MNHMSRYQLLRNRGNDEDAPFFRRLAVLRRQNARDANGRGNAAENVFAPFGNAKPAGVREACYERVTVNGMMLGYVASVCG